MDAKKAQEILDSYICSDIEDEDVKEEIRERIAGLSDDPEVEVIVCPQIDSEHEGLLVEVMEFGEVTEYIASVDLIDLDEDEENDD